MYGFSTSFNGSVEEAVNAVTSALADEGFGVCVILHCVNPPDVVPGGPGVICS